MIKAVANIKPYRSRTNVQHHHILDSQKCAADPYALEHEASSDHHMHDVTWHPHGSQPYGDGMDHGVSTAGPNLECDDSSNTLQSCTSRPMLAIAIGETELRLHQLCRNSICMQG